MTLELRFLIGLVILAYGLAVPAVVLNIPILDSAVLLLVVAAGAIFIGRPPAAASSADNVSIVIVLFAIVGFAIIWSHETSYRVETFAATGLFKLWLDYFVHAGVIASFGDPLSIGRGDPGMVDVPARFYHFVSYALPGLAVRSTGMTALQAVTAVWLPLGIFSTALGVFVLGRALSGFAGGAISICFLAAVPDNAAYGLRQGFLSFHWMLETAPTSLYALPCACACLASLAQWCRDTNRRALVGSALLLCAVFLLRAHIFLWLVVPWAATALAAAPRISRQQRTTLIAALVIVAVVAMLVYSRQEIAKKGLLMFTDQYLTILHNDQQPTSYDGLYRWITSALGRTAALVPGLALAYAAMGGIPLLIFLAGSVLVGRRGKREALDLLPFALLGWAGIMMLWAPTPYWGDSTEFRQRAFVLVVIVLLCWDAKWFTLLLPTVARGRFVALATCAALPFTVLGVANWKAPRMSWAESFRRVQLSPSLQAAASWLRAASRPGDAFMMAGVDPNQMLFDDATAVMALSGLPVWLAHPAIYLTAGGQRAAIAQQRLSVLARVASAADRATAEKILRGAHIRFYVVTGEGNPVWDSMHACAAFRANNVAVYQVSQDETGQ